MNVNPVEWAMDLKQHRLSADEVSEQAEMFDENKLVSTMKERLSAGEFTAFSKMFEESRQEFIVALCSDEFDAEPTEPTGLTAPTGPTEPKKKRRFFSHGD
jgi:hypothetical protein